MPEIDDRTEKPRGVIPKSMLLVVAAVVLVTAMPFVSVYITAHTARQRQFLVRQDVQTASTQDDSWPRNQGSSPVVLGKKAKTEPLPATPPAGPAYTQSARQEDPAQQEYRKRLMAAPMAPIFGDPRRLSGVPPQLSVAPGLMQNPAMGDPQVRQIAALMNLAGDPAAGLSRWLKDVPHASPVPAPASPVISTENNGNPFVVADGAFNHAHGPGYFVPRGTLLHCTLENALNGEIDGPVGCQLTEPLLSFNGQRVLIPTSDSSRPGRVTELDGESKRVQAWGQTRLGISFKHLYMPDGYQVWFEEPPALDEKGAAGIHGHVNNHTLSSLGIAGAIGLLGAAAELGSGNVLTQGEGGRMAEGAAMGMSMSSMQILSKFLNRMPTITLPPGQQVQVYLDSNYQLPEYMNHDMPADF